MLKKSNSYQNLNTKKGKNNEENNENKSNQSYPSKSISDLKAILTNKNTNHLLSVSYSNKDNKSETISSFYIGNKKKVNYKKENNLQLGSFIYTIPKGMVYSNTYRNKEWESIREKMRGTLKLFSKNDDYVKYRRSNSQNLSKTSIEIKDILKNSFINESFHRDSKLFYGKSTGKRTDSLKTYKNKETLSKEIKPQIKIGNYKVKYISSIENQIYNDKKYLRPFQIKEEGKENRNIERIIQYENKENKENSSNLQTEPMKNVLKQKEGLSFLFNYNTSRGDFNEKSNKKCNFPKENTKNRVFGCNYPIPKKNKEISIPIKLYDQPYPKRKEVKVTATSYLFNKSSIVF